MANIKIAYSGAAAATVDCTLTSLTNNSWRESDLVDNTSNLYVDYLAGGLITVTGNSPGPGADTSIDIYVYGQWDASGDYTGGLTGADASWTPDGSEFLFRRLASIIVVDTINQGYEWGPVSVAQAFGGHMPQRFGFVIQNNTGQNLHSTGTNHETRVTGVYYTAT